MWGILCTNLDFPLLKSQKLWNPRPLSSQQQLAEGLRAGLGSLIPQSPGLSTAPHSMPAGCWFEAPAGVSGVQRGVAQAFSHPLPCSLSLRRTLGSGSSGFGGEVNSGLWKGGNLPATASRPSWALPAVVGGVGAWDAVGLAGGCVESNSEPRAQLWKPPRPCHCPPHRCPPLPRAQATDRRPCLRQREKVQRNQPEGGLGLWAEVSGGTPCPALLPRDKAPQGPGCPSPSSPGPDHSCHVVFPAPAMAAWH